MPGRAFGQHTRQRDIPPIFLGPPASRLQLGDFTHLPDRLASNLLITLAASFGIRGAHLYHSEAKPMFRFDQLIRRDMIIRDVKQRHPETVGVFEQFHYRSSCDDCDIETVARKNGLKVQDVVAALNHATFGPKTEIDEHTSE
jgi:hypothetical protein